jgi:ribosomal peptide maturation radical SAM protein 1
MKTKELVASVVSDKNQDASVALVTMPFWSTVSPSIQLGLLKAILAQHGILATVYYLNLPFAKIIGYTSYNILSNVRSILLGEWLFSQSAFGPRSDDEKFLEEFSPIITDVLKQLKCTEQDLLDIRHNLVPEYIESCLDAVPWDRHSIVGFTSTFQQNAASIGFARVLKEKFPLIKVVMGGANFEDEMGYEYVRAFPWIDYAIIGEGDDVFPKLVKELMNNQPVQARPGVAMRSDTGVIYKGPAPMVTDLTNSPPPDYEEFFATGKRLQLFSDWEAAGEIRLPFESSRGCWWGERSHCTFCGLNGTTMKFRAKPPEKVLEELIYLTNEYRWTKFQAVDNIMDYRFFDTFCSALANGKYDIEIFYELKANMTREQIQKLRHAGVRHIQPGIESLSSHILTLMKKGVKGIHNVELLKWSKYYDIQVDWNLLVGFPGERLEDCQQQIDWVKSILHLQPPHGMGHIWLERFSPYYTRQDLYPVSDIQPQKSYYYVYPSELVDLTKIAYFFDYQMGDTIGKKAYEPLHDEVVKWRSRWDGKSVIPSLTYKRAFELIFVADNRWDGHPIVYTYSGPMLALYLFCETRKPLTRCLTFLREKYGHMATEDVLEEAISHFIDRRLMIREDDVVLSLALPENYQW